MSDWLGVSDRLSGAFLGDARAFTRIVNQVMVLRRQNVLRAAQMPSIGDVPRAESLMTSRTLDI
jgi:hypothetical protein